MSNLEIEKGQVVIRPGRATTRHNKRMGVGALPSNGGCTRAAASIPGSDGGTSVNMPIDVFSIWAAAVMGENGRDIEREREGKRRYILIRQIMN